MPAIHSFSNTLFSTSSCFTVMFTPPPSPLPPAGQAVDVIESTYLEDTHVTPSKQKLHWSIRWTVLVIPLTLMLLAVYTRFWAHPAAFDLLVDGDHAWTKVTDWSLHEPHVHTHTSHRMVKRSSSNRLVVRNTTFVPTVPVNPTLPTPFPQPFDTTLSANFSTTGCYNFFMNMSQSASFTSCRPFSLLISTSYAFEEAQRNVSLMNVDVWGTCNTDTSQEQCDANMAWFASSLQASCQIDLANQVQTAVLTLNALYAYDLMRNIACAVDAETNAYCYVEAVASIDPSSYWFYQLPLGQSLGNITTTACGECTSGLMASYGNALNSSSGANLDGLAQTYNGAVDTLNEVCQTSLAKVTPVSRSNGASVGARTNLLAVVVLAALLAM